ncbi:MAG: ABC transporter permease [Rhodocyclaceae bacterium]|nr:ABC transporter permease [Rhodocyclaceae bacterium]
MAKACSSFFALFKHRYLIGQLVRRDVLLKYRGSFLGIGWSFLYPLLLLAVFSLVFGRFMGGTWPRYGEAPQALVIYCGLVVFTPFAEILGSAPRLLLGYQNYVKKIIFPTEILPVMQVFSASVHALANAAILFAATVLICGFQPTQLLLPLMLLPPLLLALGVAWLLAAAGVFVRDLVHVMPVFSQVLMFLSPVVYPAELVPHQFRWLVLVNPLAPMIENVRATLLSGSGPDWIAWCVTLTVGMAAATLGLTFFLRGKEEFADVL